MFAEVGGLRLCFERPINESPQCKGNSHLRFVSQDILEISEENVSAVPATHTTWLGLRHVVNLEKKCPHTLGLGMAHIMSAQGAGE